jgi:hypothetical protein
MSVISKIVTALLVVGSFFTGSARQLQAMADQAQPQKVLSDPQGRPGTSGGGATCVG